MSIQTGQLLNATPLSATAITHRSCNHVAIAKRGIFLDCSKDRADAVEKIRQ
jgi:hypothetical protein